MTAPERRTYETCHKHFSCPDGEECWYSSADYYWDCGGGASRLSKAVAEAVKAERARVLDLLIAYRKAQSKEFGIQTVWEGEGAYILELRQQEGKP